MMNEIQHGASLGTTGSEFEVQRLVLFAFPAEEKMVPALASVWHQGELCTEASGFHVMAPGVAE